MKTVRLILRLIFQTAHIICKSLCFNRETIGLWSTGEYFLWAAFSLDAIICLSHQRHTDMHWSRKSCCDAGCGWEHSLSLLTHEGQGSLTSCCIVWLCKKVQREIYEPHETGRTTSWWKAQHICNSLLSKNITKWINWSTYFEKTQL